MRCPKKYPLKFLSLYRDKALKIIQPIEEHVEGCPFCQSLLSQIDILEKKICQYEKDQDNCIFLEIFDVDQQKRSSLSLAWEPLWLGISAERSLQLQSWQEERRLKVSLRSFWNGMMGVYVENFFFPHQVQIQRGYRYLPVVTGQGKRMIEGDALVFLDNHRPFIKVSLKIPSAFKEKSITRKHSSLALVNSSFIEDFFQAKKKKLAMIEAWEKTKLRLSAQQIGIYLVYLNKGFSYTRLAKEFRKHPSYIGKTIALIRKRVLEQCSEK